MSVVYAFPDTVIQVFCKAPIVGQVKTRLQPELSAAQAVAVHEALATRTLAMVNERRLCPVQLWCAPSVEHPFFMCASVTYGVSLHLQAEGDLGQRMDAALRAGLKGYTSVILLGCDCPSLTTEDLRQAIHALKQPNEVVLAPTEDGGYSLIGVNRPQPELFIDISWSSAAVMEQTRGKIKALQLKSLELKTQWDVDTYEDYQRWLTYV